MREVGHAVEPPLDIVALRVGAAVAGTAAHIRQQHGKTLREQHLDVGPEIRSRLPHRAAMHPDDRGIAVLWHRGAWQCEPARNTRAIKAFPLHQLQIDEAIDVRFGLPHHARGTVAPQPERRWLRRRRGTEGKRCRRPATKPDRRRRHAASRSPQVVRHRSDRPAAWRSRDRSRPSRAAARRARLTRRPRRALRRHKTTEPRRFRDPAGTVAGSCCHRDRSAPAAYDHRWPSGHSGSSPGPKMCELRPMRDRAAAATYRRSHDHAAAPASRHPHGSRTR